MRLSESGELGLLAELERLGLIVGVQHDAAQLAGGARRHAGRARRGRPFPARLARLARPRLAGRGGQPERPRGLGRDAGGAARDARRARRDPDGRTWSSSTGGIAETGVPVVGGDTTQGPALVVSVTALGHSARVPGRAGAQPGDALVVTGPLGAAGAAFRERRYVRPPLRLAEGRRARRARARADGHLGRARRRRRPHRAALGCSLRARARPRPARRRRDSRRSRRSARTTSCSRRSPSPEGSR